MTLVLRPAIRTELSALCLGAALAADRAGDRRSRAASAWAAAISSSRSGAQQIGSHTQLPQRVHCLKVGEISFTASRSAASCAEPPTACCTSYVVSATLLKTPPKMLPAARS